MVCAQWHSAAGMCIPQINKAQRLEVLAADVGCWYVPSISGPFHLFITAASLNCNAERGKCLSLHIVHIFLPHKINVCAKVGSQAEIDPLKWKIS